MREDLIELAKQQAAEIARAGHNGWGNTMTEAADALEAARQDAERYRWLRDSHWYIGPEPDGCMEGVGMFDRNDGRLDAAIDQARGKGEG